MRPLRLELEGFTAFRAPVVVDFEGAELFALVGATGAGKTSIIDAITFALYGTVPRLDDRRAVAPVVSQNLNEARVRLDFAVGSERYTAVRVVRATRTGATTKEARLERAGEVIAGTADELSQSVTDLLGLTYEHFTTCVSLPQGQFARFLHDKPRDRQDLLVRLLELGLYDQVAKLARYRAGQAATQAEVLNGQLDRLAGATAEAQADAKARVERLAGLGARLARVRPEIDELDRAARAAGETAERCAVQVERLAGLRIPDGVPELAEALVAASSRRAACQVAEEAAAAAVIEAEERQAQLPPRSGLEQQRDDVVRWGQLRRSVAQGRQAAAAADDEVQRSARAEAAAEAALADQAGALERLRVEQRAVALVPELRLGEPCPVCRQPVAHVPEAHVPDLAAAEQGLAAARRQLDEARHARRDAHTEQARVGEKLARFEDDLDELMARLPDTAAVALRAGGDADAALLATIEAQRAEVVAAEEMLVRVREGDQTARRATRDAERAYDQLRAREAEARRTLDAARDTVAALEPPAIARRDLAADWDLLVRWAGERRPILDDQLDQHRREAVKLAEQSAGRLAEVIEACCEADVATPAGQWPGEAVAAAHARAEEAARQLERDRAEAARLRARVQQATEQRQVAEVLAGHLAANRFEKWLLDEAVHRLVERASTVLADLSANAYALSVDDRSGAFTVIDHANASQARPARTLSGGETFLASLALALALADEVSGLAAGGAARLEALFLDEGFGTLDADTLDVVSTALDELGARGRMVGVVTHVRDLADRLPVRFEVRKVAGSATVERVEG